VQSLADLGEISAGIAHEFRNSLSTISVTSGWRGERIHLPK